MCIIAVMYITTAEFGCGFVVNKRLRHLVSGFTPVNERIVTICIRAKFYNISLICAYAQMEEKNDMVKAAFYAMLEDVHEKCPARVAKIVHRNFNAKVRREGIFGPAIGHKDIHKATWTSPDQSTLNQIDHIVIDKRHLSSVLDVRTFRGPNIDFDHYLVAVKFRLRVSASRSGRSSALRKLHVMKLRSKRTAEAFSAQHLGKLRHYPKIDSNKPTLKL